jgi:hypothetical protein
MRETVRRLLISRPVASGHGVSAHAPRFIPKQDGSSCEYKFGMVRRGMQLRRDMAVITF